MSNGPDEVGTTNSGDDRDGPGRHLDNGGAFLREPECRNDDTREVGHSTVVDHSQESDEEQGPGLLVLEQ